MYNVRGVGILSKSNRINMCCSQHIELCVPVWHNVTVVSSLNTDYGIVCHCELLLNYCCNVILFFWSVTVDAGHCEPFVPSSMFNSTLRHAVCVHADCAWGSICMCHMFTRRWLVCSPLIGSSTHKEHTPVRSTQFLILPLHIRLHCSTWPPLFSTL